MIGVKHWWYYLWTTHSLTILGTTVNWSINPTLLYKEQSQKPWHLVTFTSLLWYLTIYPLHFPWRTPFTKWTHTYVIWWSCSTWSVLNGNIAALSVQYIHDNSVYRIPRQVLQFVSCRPTQTCTNLGQGCFPCKWQTGQASVEALCTNNVLYIWWRGSADLVSIRRLCHNFTKV